MSGWVVGFALRHETDQRLLHSVAVVAAVVAVVVAVAVVVGGVSYWLTWYVNTFMAARHHRTDTRP